MPAVASDVAASVTLEARDILKFSLYQVAYIISQIVINSAIDRQHVTKLILSKAQIYNPRGQARQNTDGTHLIGSCGSRAAAAWKLETSSLRMPLQY
jgi:ribosomal silencing factor RsfS